MPGNLQQWFRFQWQRVTFAKGGKLLLALILVAPLAVVLSIVGSCEFYMSQAVSTCNCPSEKMIMARTAFERNYQFTGYMFPLVDAALALPLFLVPWTRWRIMILLGSLIAGFVAWECFPQYVALLPDSSDRWWAHPVSSVTAGAYSDISREFIAPLLAWRPGCAMLAFACSYLLGEMVSLAYTFRRKTLSSNKQTGGCETAVNHSASAEG